MLLGLNMVLHNLQHKMIEVTAREKDGKMVSQFYRRIAGAECCKH